MKPEKPILFSGPMVRAILENRKTQTRRIVKPQPCDPHLLRILGPDGKVHYTRPSGHPDIEEAYQAHGYSVATCREWLESTKSPYPVGTRLWVRETWQWYGRTRIPGEAEGGFEYRADQSRRLFTDFADPEARYEDFKSAFDAGTANVWRPSIHMPRWASRITLEVTKVRVERLQDISEDDAVAEGIVDFGRQDGAPYPHFNLLDRSLTTEHFAVAVYAQLWQSINGPDSWNANPWVWVVEFKRIQP